MNSQNRRPNAIPDWVDVWRSRAESYNQAAAQCPRSREKERGQLIDGLRLTPGDSLIDVGAAGGYLLEGVHDRLVDQVKLYAVEPSPEHAAALPAYVSHLAASTITRFECGDATVSAVASLAGLHHTADDSAFFSEAYRVIQPGGVLGVAEVEQDSAVDRWLNGFVNKANPLGHQGRFYSCRELEAKMRAVGFQRVAAEVRHFTWDFSTVEEMARFCKELFGLSSTNENEVLDGIKSNLGWSICSAGRAHLNWSLIYGFGYK